MIGELKIGIISSVDTYLLPLFLSKFLIDMQEAIDNKIKFLCINLNN